MSDEAPKRGVMKPRPFANLLEEARSLDIDPFEGGEFGPDNHTAIAQLRADIAKAKEIDAAEAAEMADEPEKVEYTLDDTPETVMVRIHEWTAWLPAHPDPKVPALGMHDGVTSFQTAKDERLLEVAISGTGQNYVWEEEIPCERCEGTGNIEGDEKAAGGAEVVDCPNCEGKGKVKEKHSYGLYALQATLARNIDPRIAQALEAAQFEPMREELERDKERAKTDGRDRREDLLIVEHGSNRKARRDTGKGPRSGPRRSR